MRIKGRTYKVDYGHLVFATLIAGITLWYLLDARSVSTDLNNILLVQPVAIFAILMYLLIIPQCFRRADAEPEEPKAEEVDDPLAPKLPTERRQVIRMALLGVALGALVFLMNVIGFDVAIFFFSMAAMAICGERRPHYLLIFAAAVTLVTIYGFRSLMPYPMLTTIL